MPSDFPRWGALHWLMMLYLTQFMELWLAYVPAAIPEVPVDCGGFGHCTVICVFMPFYVL